jgi:hypothetical protein
MFRPDKIKQFDTICFNNTQGVLFDDPELKKSLLGFIRSGHGFVGFHAAIATFVQHPYMIGGPRSGILGGTENGGHPWMPKDSYVIKVDDLKSPLNAVFQGRELKVTDAAMQLQEPVLRDHTHVLLSLDIEKSPAPSHKDVGGPDAGQRFSAYLDTQGGQGVCVLFRVRAQSASLLERIVAGTFSCRHSVRAWRFEGRR